MVSRFAGGDAVQYNRRGAEAVPDHPKTSLIQTGPQSKQRATGVTRTRRVAVSGRGRLCPMSLASARS